MSHNVTSKDLHDKLFDSLKKVSRKVQKDTFKFHRNYERLMRKIKVSDTFNGQFERSI